VRIYAETAPTGSLDVVADQHVTLCVAIKSGGFNDVTVQELEVLEGCLHNGVIGILRNPLIETSYRRIHHYLRLVRLGRVLTPPLALRTCTSKLKSSKPARAASRTWRYQRCRRISRPHCNGTWAYSEHQRTVGFAFAIALLPWMSCSNRCRERSSIVSTSWSSPH
jgi:hypothetical protein